MTQFLIRPATAADLSAINDLYNFSVLHSTCTYQTEPETAEARAAWFARHGPRNPKYPVIVAEAGGEVVGWGSISPLHSRAAYRFTVEDSVYVRQDRQRQGLGSAILESLITQARQIGHHAIIAIIDGEQEGSVALHARFGFVEVGHLRQVGFKFERWLDVIYMEKMF